MDPNANGYGWFIDETPLADEEYVAGSGDALKATKGAAGGGIDLLTVLLHEQGHILGFADVTAPIDALMYQYIQEGERRLPTEALARDAVAGAVLGSHYLTSGDEGDHNTFSSRGASYIRFVGEKNQSDQFSGIPVIVLEAKVEPNLSIHLGAGSLIETGPNEDLVIQVTANHRARAVGGASPLFPTPLGVVDANASVGGSIEVFLGGTIIHGADLTLELLTKNEAVAIGEALALGPFTATGVNTKAVVNPAIATFVSPDSNITVDGDFTIRTLAESSARADSRGIAGSALLSIGASIAQAEVTPTVSTYIGENAVINATGSITVETLHNVGRDGSSVGNKAEAVAQASAGSFVGAGAGSDATAINAPNVYAYVAPGAVLSGGSNAGDAIKIRALSDNVATAEATALSVSGLSLGVAIAKSVANGTTGAYLEGDILTGGDLIIEALSTHDAKADSTPVAGGGSTGVGSRAEVEASPTLFAYIGDIEVTVSGDIIVRSESMNTADADALAVSAGSGVAGGGTVVEASAAPDMDTYFSEGALVHAGGDVELESLAFTDADADILAITVSGGASVGALIVEASQAGAVDTEIRSGARVNSTSGNISLLSAHNYDSDSGQFSSDNGAEVAADVSVASLGLAVDSTEINALSLTQTAAAVLANAQLVALAGSVSVTSRSSNIASSRQRNSGGAGVSVALSDPLATASGQTTATLAGEVQSAAGAAGAMSVVVTAEAVDRSLAGARASNGGVVSVGISNVTALTAPAVTASAGGIVKSAAGITVQAFSSP